MSGMASRPFRHLVHEGFLEDAETLAKRGADYEASLSKQLEKLQVDPFGACDRYDCDALPEEYEDCVRKCDIKGTRGPKVFCLIWREQGIVLPFFITPELRNSIDYRRLQPRIETHAKTVIQVIETWPDKASECEVWIIQDGAKLTINAAEALERFGHI